jgi:hypothetical protein
LARLSSEEEERLRVLHSLSRDFAADDPKKRGRDLSLRAERLQNLVAHVQDRVRRWSDAALAVLPPLRHSAEAARAKLAEVRVSVQTPDLLPATGGDEWKAQWSAAAGFAAVAYPDCAFPHTDQGARCVLCQQVLSNEAAERLQRLASFVLSGAQKEADEADRLLRDALETVSVEAAPVELMSALDDLAQEDAAAATAIEDALDAARRVRAGIAAWVQGGADLPPALPPVTTERVIETIAALQSRAVELQSSPGGMPNEMKTELKELEARQKLRDNLESLLAAIDRKKRIAAYGQCLEEVATNAITKKSTELTKELVSDALRERFVAELQAP